VHWKTRPLGFFLGQQVTIVVSSLHQNLSADSQRRSFRAGHASVVALGGTSFKAEHAVTRLVTEHAYADKDVSWLPGWVDDTEALVATRTLVGSFES
jgi:hypothetical protein